MDLEDRKRQVLKGFVRQIQTEPFQAHYRRMPIGVEVLGWSARLQSYFWPKPVCDVSFNARTLKPLGERMKSLVNPVLQKVAWTDAEQAEAVACAQEILRWGGVPQKKVTASDVRSVIESAIRGERLNQAPMNSGWTKVAAFATEGCGQDIEQVIWDSRVSASVISRLDALLNEPSRESTATMFPGLGLVPGRGGFRLVRQNKLRLRWPNGYGRWSAQFAGSSFVRDIRDELNENVDHYGFMPAIETTQMLWTVRGVEMVLFMDGY